MLFNEGINSLCFQTFRWCGDVIDPLINLYNPTFHLDAWECTFFVYRTFSSQSLQVFILHSFPELHKASRWLEEEAATTIFSFWG